MKQNFFDIVIIGAGVIGHSIAFKLKQCRPDLRLAVVGDPMNSLMASRAAAVMKQIDFLDSVEILFCNTLTLLKA